jgi:MFS family permease
VNVVREGVTDALASLRTVFTNGSLRRLMLAFGGSLIGDWAYGTAIAVWAFSVGGAKVLAVWAVVRFVLMAVCTPVAATFVDRLSRKKVMIAVDVARCVLLVAIAASMATVPPLVVFVLAGVVAVLGTPFRPAQRAMIPSLVTRPEELTAVNGTSSTLESLSFFAGPALAAGMLATTSVEVVLLFDAVTFLWSAVLVAGVHPVRVAEAAPAIPAIPAAAAPVVATAVESPIDAPDPAGDSEPPAPAPDEPHEGFLREMVAGFLHIWRDTGLRVVIGLCCAQTLVAGASAVFVVAVAFDLIHIGAPGVGLLDSMLGVGAIVGGFIALARAPRQRLGNDFGIGVVLWSLPLVLVAVWPTTAVAVLVMMLLGLANPLVDVNLDTLLQRLTPDHLLGRVFGTLESAYIASMAIGAALMPVLIDLLGLAWGMAALGVGVTLMVLPAFPVLRRLDRTLTAPADLPLLLAIEMFSPLDRGTLEALARKLDTVRIGAGEVVFAEGDPGDLFYVIESGEVEVAHGATVLRHEGRGEYFGEIALLRNIPRTAEVRAVADTVLKTLDGATFLDAVLGSREAVTAAETIVARRILAG